MVAIVTSILLALFTISFAGNLILWKAFMIARKNDQESLEAYRAERKRCAGHAKHLGATLTAQKIESGEAAPPERKKRLVKQSKVKQLDFSNIYTVDFEREAKLKDAVRIGKEKQMDLDNVDPYEFKNSDLNDDGANNGN